MTGQRTQHLDGDDRSTRSGRVHRRVQLRGHRRGLATGLLATVLLVTVATVTMSCADSPRASSTVGSITSTTSTISATVVPSPVCDALLEAVGTILTGDGTTDWSAMVATLGAVTPQLPEGLRNDWTIVLDRLVAMASGPGAAPLDLNDPASVQRYAEQLMSADRPELAEALGNIQTFVEANCPI